MKRHNDLPAGWRQPPETTAEPVPLRRPYVPPGEVFPPAYLMPPPPPPPRSQFLPRRQTASPGRTPAGATPPPPQSQFLPRRRPASPATPAGATPPPPPTPSAAARHAATASLPRADARGRDTAAAPHAAARHAAMAAYARHHRRRVPETGPVVRVRQLHRALHQPGRARRAGPARPGTGSGLVPRRGRPTRLPVLRAARPRVPGPPPARVGRPGSVAPLVFVGLVSADVHRLSSLARPGSRLGRRGHDMLEGGVGTQPEGPRQSALRDDGKQGMIRGGQRGAAVERAAGAGGPVA